MDIVSVLAYLSLLMLSILSYSCIKQRKKMTHKSPKKDSTDLQLLPGSMGLPYVGETLHLYSQDPNVFFAEKQKRYGDVFKTHILGYPCVMLASPQASRFVLMTHAHMFKDDKGQVLSEEQIADNVIGVLFAAQDTTASALTWIIKYLSDDKKLLEAVKGEQLAIWRLSMTWNQTKDMKLAHMVILESLRMSSMISFTFREAVADVEYNSWKVMPLFRSLHHNPNFFPDPQKFDPSRFEVAPKANTFMPFGSGVHACPGYELAKLEILILLHHLITKFRWEVV